MGLEGRLQSSTGESLSCVLLCDHMGCRPLCPSPTPMENLMTEEPGGLQSVGLQELDTT